MNIDEEYDRTQHLDDDLLLHVHNMKIKFHMKYSPSLYRSVQCA